jgi:hypothetical protein
VIELDRPLSAEQRALVAEYVAPMVRGWAELAVQVEQHRAELAVQAAHELEALQAEHEQTEQVLDRLPRDSRVVVTYRALTRRVGRCAPAVAEYGTDRDGGRLRPFATVTTLGPQARRCRQQATEQLEHEQTEHRAELVALVRELLEDDTPTTHSHPEHVTELRPRQHELATTDTGPHAPPTPARVRLHHGVNT